MTAFAIYLAHLERTARNASMVEEDFRREAAIRIEELKTQRDFAFRRLHLVQAIGRAVAACHDEDQAGELGCAALLRHLGWSGHTPTQREVASRFAPVVLAVWEADHRAEERGENIIPPQTIAHEIGDALSSFEAWYLQTRKVSFLHLMEWEVVDVTIVGS